MSDRRLETMLALPESRRVRRRDHALASEIQRDPVLADSLERQRRLLAALRQGGPAPPDSLATRLAPLQPPPRTRHRLGRKARSRTLALVASAAVAVLAALLVAIRPGAERGPLPSAAEVSAVWTLPSSGTPVAAAAGHPTELDVSYHAIVFPNYHDQEGWHPVGVRRDRINGIPTVTVFYATGHRRAAYTVIPTARVAVPAGAIRLSVGRLSLREFRSSDRWIVTFERAGNTCVLTAAAPRERQWLIKLAVWHGGPATSPS